MHNVECPECGRLHDIEALEPSFRRPDEFLELVERDEVEYQDGKDACAVRATDLSWERYFIRVLIPFTILSLDEPISWGAWVEVTSGQFDRVGELWDDPNQSSEPPFQARLANDIVAYDDSMSITGSVSLTDPSNIPTFHMTAPADHPFVVEQRSAITPARAADWLVFVYHPEALIQRRIDKLLSARGDG